MLTPNRRPPPSSSKKPSVSDYPIKKATKPQLSFLGIGWKNYGNCAKSVPEAFVLGPFMQGLNDPVHHKDFGEEAPAAAGSSQPLEWKFAQVFGERTAGEEVQEVSFNYNERRLFRGDRSYMRDDGWGSGVMVFIIGGGRSETRNGVAVSETLRKIVEHTTNINTITGDILRTRLQLTTSLSVKTAMYGC